MKSTPIHDLGYRWQDGPPPDWLKDHKQAEAATIFRIKPKRAKKDPNGHHAA